MPRVKIVYKHYKSGEELECEGELYDKIHHSSDRIIVIKDDGDYEDILKDTIVSKTHRKAAF